MKVAVMQPYFLPYIGYWQLLKAADAFVLLDDVNFINRGYIARNRILLSGQAHLFSIPLDKPSQNKLIKDIRLNFPRPERDKLLKTIRAAYQKAPYFESVYPLAENLVRHEADGITEYVRHSLSRIMGYLDLPATIFISSDLEKNNDLKGQDRIIDICRNLKADTYLNPPGGRELYDRASFEKSALSLKFLQPGVTPYRQFGDEFVPNLSFLDLMMFNDRPRLKEMLENYTLHEPN